MTVKTAEDRALLRSVFLATGDPAVLDLLERSTASGRYRRVVAAVNAKVVAAAPLLLAAAVLYAFH